MTNSQKITELQQQIKGIEYNIIEAYPGRLSQDDIECVSDRYQDMLEYQEYREELEVQISEIQADIAHLQSLPANAEYTQTPTQQELLCRFSEAVGYEPDLRYVSEEVGYVDQDEEYI